MINAATLAERGAQTVRANGIDIAYVEAGDGPPLVLLHGGLASTGPLWADSPVAYVAHMATLAKHFRVIAPDTRGSGATVHGDGGASFSVLADDVLALIDALGLDRPLLAGFSEGAATATIVAIREPGAVRALAAHAGYDIFNPEAPVFAMGRAIFGGHPEATEADPDAAEAAFQGMPPMAATFAHDEGRLRQRPGRRPLAPLPPAVLRPGHPLARLHLRRLPSHHRADPDPHRRPRPLLLGRGSRRRLPQPPRRRARHRPPHRARHHARRRRHHHRVPPPSHRNRALMPGWTRESDALTGAVKPGARMLACERSSSLFEVWCQPVEVQLDAVDEAHALALVRRQAEVALVVG